MIFYRTLYGLQIHSDIEVWGKDPTDLSYKSVVKWAKKKVK